MKNTLMCAAAVGLVLSAFSASAQTVENTTTIETTTIERQMVKPDAKMIDISEFDTNNSGTISIDEVGEKLFYLYDIDGNELIDNQEFDQPLIATVVPVERETITVVEVNGEGIATETSYQVSQFMAETRLAMFDKENDGLSPHEFIGEGFLKLDSNDDMGIDINEWKSAYIVDFEPHDDSQRYN